MVSNGKREMEKTRVEKFTTHQTHKKEEEPYDKDNCRITHHQMSSLIEAS